jgi:BatD DUF11 like domain
MLFSFLTASGDELSLTAALDKTDIPFESSVNLNMEIRWQGGIGRYGFEILPLPSTQNLTVLGSTSAVSSRTEAGQEITTRTFKYTFKPTKAGVGIIEPIVLNYVSMPDSTAGQLTSQRFQVIIAEPIPPPVKSNKWKYLISGMVLIVIMAAGIFFVLRWKRSRMPVAPIKTPEESFLDELAVVKKESQSDRKIFFTRLYKLLNGYLERKYGLVTAGKSTSAVLNEMERIEFPAGERENISGWLTMADKEKYAPIEGAPGDIIRLIAELENFFRK